MSQNSQERVRQLLTLTPLVEKAIPLDEFLLSLREHPERAESAFSVVYRAIVSMGAEDADKEPDPERRDYLRMLASLDIPSLKAFKHVAGNQRFTPSPLQSLKSGASGGVDLRKMMIIVGGTGAGKDYFRDGIIWALERYTDEVEKVYAVEGCPYNENPVNLLKLLKHEQLQRLAEETGLGAKLWQLLDAACEPCQHCYERIVGTVSQAKDKPSFEQVQVVPMRLSARSAGIAEWKPGDTCTLAAALNKANRGFISMPDSFIERQPKEGETDERLLLMTAPEYRRLPGKPSADGGATAHSPLDVFILCTTNPKALEKFLSEVVPDKEAFTRRCVIVRLPYNLIRCEEVRTYREELARYKEKAHFDPLALKLLATLAVVSRLSVPEQGQPFVDPIDRLRLYQGEQIVVKPRPASQWRKTWDTADDSYRGSGGGLWDGDWGSSGSRRGSSGSQDAGVAGNKFKLPADIAVTTELLWSVPNHYEGKAGLDIPYMLGLLSKINNLGLTMSPKHKCVNSIVLLQVLRAAMAKRVKADNITDEQRAVFERCLKWLGGVPEPDEGAADKPELIEAEFRRMLRQMLLGVFAPDYDERAQQLFADYRLHAPAAFEGKREVKDPKLGTVPVNLTLVSELDRHRLDKPKKADLSEEDKKFRGQLDAIIAQLREDHAQQYGQDAVKNFKVTWKTIPELAKAIRAKLDAEIGLVMEKLISNEVRSDLDEREQVQLERAEHMLAEMGFCPACQKPILEYAKQTKIWSFTNNN